MKIGYLHLGTSLHGIHRYGKLLATEAQQRSNLTVLEVELVLTDNQSQNLQLFLKAAEKLSQADLVHIQSSKFNDRLWGESWVQIDHLKAFFKHCSCPIVATMHDVFYESWLRELQLQFPKAMPFELSGGSDNISRHSLQLIIYLKQIALAMKGWWINTFGAPIAALNEINKYANLILVCSQEEAQRIAYRVNPKKLKIIPHFVESRSQKTVPVDIRKTLNLVNKKIITLLGFIGPYKGHELVIEAISYLSPEVQVIFAGDMNLDKEYVRILQELVQKKDLGNRVRFTGFLNETELEEYLRATDVAICPFKQLSASGSISTWISVHCPILASDLPQIREYNQIEPEAIQVFKPYTPIALARAIQRSLGENKELQLSRVAKLGQKLSLSNILDQHLTLYKTIIQNSNSDSTY
jgi:glycosyltransferase involved in cell wall biosynthesis